MQKHKFKKGMMVTNNTEFLTSKNTVCNLSTTIPKGTEFVIKKTDRGIIKNKYLIQNEQLTIWIYEGYIDPKNNASQKEGLLLLIAEEIKSCRLHVKNLIEEQKNKEKGFEIFKELEPGIYLFTQHTVTGLEKYDFLFHLEGFHSKGLKGKFLASDITNIKSSSAVHPLNICEAKRVSKKELPLYIGWKYKSIEFDRILKGK